MFVEVFWADTLSDQEVEDTLSYFDLESVDDLIKHLKENPRDLKSWMRDVAYGMEVCINNEEIGRF